jgi:Na+/proline symporter
LVEASKRHPVSGNAEGSYLTMQSKEGAVFFVINIVGNFGTVSLPLQRVIRILAWILREIEIWPEPALIFISQI